RSGALTASRQRRDKREFSQGVTNSPRPPCESDSCQFSARLNRSLSKTEMFSRCILVLVTSAVLAASPATAQTLTPDPARRYPLPTYDENWQFLSDPNR